MNIDVSTEAGLVALDLYLSERSYIESHVPSQADSDMFKIIAAKCIPDNLVHLGRWFRHIESFGTAKNNFPPLSNANKSYQQGKGVQEFKTIENISAPKVS